MAGDIVCGVDDSIGARRAVGLASDLATELSKRLLLVHVTGGERSFPYGDGPGRERRRHAAWQHGDTVFSALRRDQRMAAEVQERIEPGDTAMTLAAVAQEERAAFVVMGSRGRGEIGAALLGSVSDSLERLAPCPVIVVPNEAAPTPAGFNARGASIVCGIADRETEQGLVEFAADLAGALGTRLEVVHADSEHALEAPVPTAGEAEEWPPGPDPYGQRPLGRLEPAMHLADVHGVEAGGRLAVGPASLALHRTAKNQDALLIVIGSRRGGRLRLLLGGSVSCQLIRDVTTPIVVVPPRAHGPEERRLVPPIKASNEKSKIAR